MHSSFSLRTITRTATRSWQRLVRAARVWPVALVVVTGLSLPQASRGQSFVQEIANDDIGRIGPTGMATDTIGATTFLYVSDQNHGRIIKYDLNTGTRVAVWGVNGNGPLQFNSPYGIAIDPVSHDLFIAERGNHRIQRITNQGVFVQAWGGIGTANGQFDGPIGIAADAVGNFYVTDHNNNRIQKFSVSGTTVNHVATWSGPGFAAGQLNGPYGITLDASNTLWVADSFNRRLQRFDTNGNLLAVIGAPGSGDGQFNIPTWVTFDSTGAYYVCETNLTPLDGTANDIQHQRIQKFTAAGAFITKWGSFGEAGGQFRLPFMIILDSAGMGYVSDYYNTRLQKFNMNAPLTQAAPVINSLPTAAGTAGSFFLYNTTALAFPAATLFSATGLPDGLSINATSGAILGTPSVGGSFTTTVSATNTVGVGTKGVSITIASAAGAPTITSATSGTAVAGASFTYGITATNNPTNFTASGLPAGLTLNATTGVISGNPASAGTYSVTITAGNGFGSSQANLILTITTTVISVLPSQAVLVGSPATFNAQSSGATYLWHYNGTPIAGATGSSYTVNNAQPASAGIYSVVINNGTVPTQTTALGISSAIKVVGDGMEVGTDITHPNGNIYDQVLLQGPAATITADPNQVTRMSYIDLNDDIVQVEFSGAGSLSLVLDNASGPASPAKYNQPGVVYMRGHASIVISGAGSNTHMSVFSVGRANAVNQDLFLDGMAYDGFADIASIAIASPTGQFGSVRTANASFLHTRGLTGLYAPGVALTDVMYIGDISASDSATPVILIGSGGTTQINGGDLFQTNSRSVQVSGLTQLHFVNGSSSHGTLMLAQMCRGRLEQNGADVTTQIVVNPN